MNDRDPIEALESYYRELGEIPIPTLVNRRAIHWWEAAGGIAAGAAAVVVAVSICLNLGNSGAGPNPGLTEHQVRMAGLQIDALPPHRRTQGGRRWLV